jgi:flagellar basal body-associated protein FliL
MEENTPREDNSSLSVFKKYGPFALAVLLAQVLLAWVVIAIAFKDNTPEPAQDELIPEVHMMPGQTLETRQHRLPYFYIADDLRDIVANPAGTNADRIVMATVQLGLEAYDREKDPPENDITKKLDNYPELLETLDKNSLKMKGVILEILLQKTVDQFSGESKHEIEDEVRKQLNEKVFKILFQNSEENSIEILVQEAQFAGLVIQ